MTLNDNKVSEKSFTNKLSFLCVFGEYKWFLACSSIQSRKEGDFSIQIQIEVLKNAQTQMTNSYWANNSIFSTYLNLIWSRFVFTEKDLLLLTVAKKTKKNLHFNTMPDIAYILYGHGIKLSEYPSRFIMVIDLTSTQQSPHDFIHPRTNPLLKLNWT